MSVEFIAFLAYTVGMPIGLTLFGVWAARAGWTFERAMAWSITVVLTTMVAYGALTL